MAQPNPTLLERDALASLNQLRDGPAALRLASHLLITVAGGLVWGQQPWPLALRLVGLLLYGLGLATCFAPLHECCHRTAFRSRRVNDTVAWIAGLLSFYNATYYRRYHQWHHHYTHQPGLDPELDDPVPTNAWAYLREVSGWNWWSGKWGGYARLLWGDLSNLSYLSPEAIPQVRRSVRLQFAVYAALSLASVVSGTGFLLWFWLLPLAVGQPLLRFVLLADVEHAVPRRAPPLPFTPLPRPARLPRHHRAAPATLRGLPGGASPPAAQPATPGPAGMSASHQCLGDFPLACGHTLAEAQLTYLQIGELNAQGSNLILVSSSYGARPDDLAWLACPVLDPERWCIVIAGIFGNGASSSASHGDNVAAQRQLLREVFEVERICCVRGTARSASHSGPVPRRLTSHPIVVSCRPSRRPISARLCPSLCRSSICALCSSLRPSLNKRSRFITHPEPRHRVRR